MCHHFIGPLFHLSFSSSHIPFISCLVWSYIPCVCSCHTISSFSSLPCSFVSHWWGHFGECQWDHTFGHGSNIVLSFIWHLSVSGLCLSLVALMLCQQWDCPWISVCCPSCHLPHSVSFQPVLMHCTLCPLLLSLISFLVDEDVGINIPHSLHLSGHMVMFLWLLVCFLVTLWHHPLVSCILLLPLVLSLSFLVMGAFQHPLIHLWPIHIIGLGHHVWLVLPCIIFFMVSINLTPYC